MEDTGRKTEKETERERAFPLVPSRISILLTRVADISLARSRERRYFLSNENKNDCDAITFQDIF